MPFCYEFLFAVLYFALFGLGCLKAECLGASPLHEVTCGVTRRMLHAHHDMEYAYILQSQLKGHLGSEGAEKGIPSSKVP